jgi:GAF domain-containing protein
LVLLDEGATWTGVGAAGASVLLLVLEIAVFMRWRRAPAREIARVQAPGQRTNKVLAELTRALADPGEGASRLSALEGLGATLDLDEALERALRAVTALAEADAALIVMSQADGEPITASHGLTADESDRDLLGVRPEAGRARAVKLGYLYTPEEKAHDAFRLDGGLAVPLQSEHGTPVGTLAVFWRREERPVTNERLAQCEELAAAFGPALENARLYSETRGCAVPMRSESYSGARKAFGRA